MNTHSHYVGMHLKQNPVPTTKVFVYSDASFNNFTDGGSQGC